MMDCYNIETHTCDGRCQGHTNCPIALGNPDKEVMLEYIKESDEYGKTLSKVFEEARKQMKEKKTMIQANDLIRIYGLLEFMKGYMFDSEEIELIEDIEYCCKLIKEELNNARYNNVQK